MARWQDFPTVTPTASDNIPIVQAAGQGLATYGSTIGSKMDKANPTGTGSFSLNRKASTTIGNYSFAEGSGAEASANQAHAEGYQTVASGNSSHAEGYQTSATAIATHSEGSGTTASGDRSHAEGINTTSTGTAAHAEGSGAVSSGIASHAEGTSTASGNGSHAEGGATEASGAYSHSEGRYSIASGERSHAEGGQTIANHRAQHVFGDFNIADASTAAATARGTYIEIVGNGTSDTARSNARTLDWSGNETIAGTLTQSSDAKLKDIKAEDIPDVSGIKAVRFTWKKDANRDDSEHIGYIAQDVEKALPFLVKEDAEGNKTLDYIAFLVAKIDNLEKRIAELEK